MYQHHDDTAVTISIHLILQLYSLFCDICIGSPSCCHIASLAEDLKTKFANL